MILVIDNYDSFTYNLVQYIGHFYQEIKVVRNDKITIAEIEKEKPKGILISPGPKTPREAGISVEVIQKLYKKIPILGVCLGHQAIAFAFGGNIVLANTIMHGKMDSIRHDKQGIYQDIQNPLSVVRYHSLVAEKQSLPNCLEISATSDDGTIMGLRHKEAPFLEGVQFHPESIKTEHGYKMIANFLKASGIAITS